MEQKPAGHELCTRLPRTGGAADVGPRTHRSASAADDVRILN